MCSCPEIRVVKIELVFPASPASALIRSRSLGILAALTPRDIQVTSVDERLKPLDLEKDLDFDADLAGITISTRNVRRGYQIAKAYRDHGVKVVLGGIHASAVPEEGLQHADAVVIGEAEGIWETLLDDLKRGQLQKTYRHEKLPAFDRPPWPRWDIFTSRKYVPMYPVQASRGCAFNCDFCSVVPFFGNRLRLREVEDVVAEIEQLDGRRLFFTDDDILCNRRFSKKLLRELAPLKLGWIGQASVTGLRYPEIPELLRKYGCRGVLVGFESTNAASLKDCGKRQNDPKVYLELVHRLADHGVGIVGSFVLGLDSDTPDIFEQILEFSMAAKFGMAVFCTLTPYPGTPLYDRLLSEGRLLKPRWWLDPLTDYPLHRPKNMTPEQLYEGDMWLWKEFYNHSSIMKRFPANARMSLFALLSYFPFNYFQRYLALKKFKEGQEYFASQASLGSSA